MVKSTDFVESTEYIRDHYKVEYKNGFNGQKSGSVYLCDCRGYLIWALNRLGTKLKSPGTNYMIRNQVRDAFFISKPSELKTGMSVFKYVRPGEPNYKLPDRYKKGNRDYNAKWGEIDVYHVGTVVSTSPLTIRHCSGGGILTATELGNWTIAGWLKCVETDTSVPTSSKPVKPIEIDAVSGASPSVRVILPEGKTGSTVFIRSAESQKSPYVVRVPVGAEIELLKKGSTWHKVRYNGKSGYMMAEFVEVRTNES